ncbi:MAG: RNA polymerase subunit sigma-24 [Bacteroidetes bacterium RIFCSPLOWO2_12_FULL_31_6]|nr:MAG: RNA polymerase subunit sigma-24 [Bacteroidetes bacterium RIFCSPLOWO2_12_FULL_31_6]
MAEELTQELSEKAKYDYNLVRLAAKGNQTAYAELMKRYRDSIYFMLLRMVNNKDDADDLTIEAFTKAFSKLDQYTPNFAFSTWLFKIASNNCIDYIRKQRQTIVSLDRTFTDDEGSEKAVDIKEENPDPEEKYIIDQKTKLMQEVVNSLKPRYRMLIEMRYFKEYSYEEISEHLDLPLGTVKAQLHRAREFLYHILKTKHQTL